MEESFDSSKVTCRLRGKMDIDYMGPRRAEFFHKPVVSGWKEKEGKAA